MDDAERTIRRLRSDSRADQEDAEAAAAELSRAVRSLRDALLDHARSGAEMRVEVGGSSFVGRVVHVGDDVIRIVVADQSPMDIAVSAMSAVFVSGESSRPVAVSSGYPATLLARCRELLQVNAEVEIGRRSSPPIAGTLMAATATHVEVAPAGGGVWLVPIVDVSWVLRTGR